VDHSAKMRWGIGTKSGAVAYQLGRWSRPSLNAVVEKRKLQDSVGCGVADSG